MSEAGAGPDGSEIAIVGMAGRFPAPPTSRGSGATCARGRESIRFFSREELERAGEDPVRLDDPQYVPARPVLEGVELFDAAFFGMSPREAAVLNPQHRLFLECAWHASRTPPTTPSASRARSPSTRGRRSAPTSSTTCTRTDR